MARSSDGPARRRRLAGPQSRSIGGPGFALLALLAVLSALGCGSSARRNPALLTPVQMQAAVLGAQGGVPGQPGTPDEAFDTTYRLNPGDMIDVKFAYHPEENERVVVQADGKLELQITGDLKAAGLTPRELEKEVVRASSVRLKHPVVSVSVIQHSEQRAYIGGDVGKPGFVPLRPGLTPVQAIVQRGGPLDTANLSEVLLITRNGDQVQSVKMDLRAIMKGEEAQDLQLAAGDIVIVPRTWIGKADIWVDQYIRGFLPTIPTPGFDLIQFFAFF